DEVRKNAIPIPAAIPELGPAIIVLTLPPYENQTIDRARPTETAPPRPVDFSILHVGFGGRVETPIVRLVEHRFPITDGNVNPQVVVSRAGLQQQDAVTPARAQAIGEHASGRSSADDDVVEQRRRFPTHFFLSHSLR